VYALEGMLLLAVLVAASFAASPPTVPSGGTIDHDPDDPLIYGGEPVEPGAWPAVVAVRTSKLCTGTLVAPNLVLTAAHCFDPIPTGPVGIYFGDTQASASVVGSTEWGSHPDFCLPSECEADLHDFAWVKLPTAVTTFDPILPITNQAEFDEAMQVGREMTFVGFGQNEQEITGIKRQVTSSLTAFNQSGREFRAGSDGKDTCLGDSGGPALVQLSSGEWRVAGVISRGEECGVGGIYGVPLPELCWLRDDSGVDLLPAGCEACDCVTLHGDVPDDGCDCQLPETAPRDRGWWLALEVAALALLGAWLHRRRTA
jgi:V8-like Glu-specific endopeptidase